MRKSGEIARGFLRPDGQVLPRSEQASDCTAGPPEAIIIGAGPGGLTAALELAQSGVPCTVLESASGPGGLAKTIQYKGYRFDIGGHRFFTKIKVVEELWRELLHEDFRECARLSRIYYRGRFFKYPLEPLDALRGLGLGDAMACLVSYLLARLFPLRPETTFDAWVSNRFGRRLFKIFFESYTEKVWGIPCSEIQAEWAAQRIRALDAIALLKSMLLPQPKQKEQLIKTLINSFHYPRLGPGMMWEKCAERVQALDGTICYGARVDRILWEPGRVTAVEAGGERYSGTHFISTMPIRELIQSLDPAPPKEVLRAACDFRYRDFLTVVLILRQRDVFPDNWIYVHDPGVKVGRIQNFKNWSADMVPDPDMTCLGLEYFCFEGDALWAMSDAALRVLAVEELQRLGIARRETVVDGIVVRATKAYPIYDENHRRGLAVLRAFLGVLGNLQLVGRNGMHRYNNQDHSMLTGLLAARNILGGSYNLWNVNVDTEYQEAGEVIADGEPQRLGSTRPLAAVRVHRAGSS